MEAESSTCPLCGESRKPRQYGNGLQRCRSCRIVFNARHAPLSYDESYFTDEYRAQYGRTYVEDRESIAALSKARLSRILGIMGGRIKPCDISLLDIGSALGFFLKQAADTGIGGLQGVEISPYAAQYCRKNFKIAVTNSSFDSAEFDRGFDVITAWYFIEHCADPLASLQKIYRLLRPGGVFAFSSPSVFGPLFVFNRDEWVLGHPPDHRMDFSPRSARRVLKGLGYSRVSVRPGGIHPERVLPKGSALFAGAYGALSRLLCFSDTIEAYALKSRR